MQCLGGSQCDRINPWWLARVVHLWILCAFGRSLLLSWVGGPQDRMVSHSGWFWQMFPCTKCLPKSASLKCYPGRRKLWFLYSWTPNPGTRAHSPKDCPPFCFLSNLDSFLRVWCSRETLKFLLEIRNIREQGRVHNSLSWTTTWLVTWTADQPGLPRFGCFTGVFVVVFQRPNPISVLQSDNHQHMQIKIIITSNTTMRYKTESKTHPMWARRITPLKKKKKTELKQAWTNSLKPTRQVFVTKWRGAFASKLNILGVVLQGRQNTLSEVCIQADMNVLKQYMSPTSLNCLEGKSTKPLREWIFDITRCTFFWQSAQSGWLDFVPLQWSLQSWCFFSVASLESTFSCFFWRCSCYCYCVQVGVSKQRSCVCVCLFSSS